MKCGDSDGVAYVKIAKSPPLVSGGYAPSSLGRTGCQLVLLATQGVAQNAIVDGYNGFTFAAGNASSLGEKMTLLWNDPKLTKRMGENSRNIAVTQFSWTTVAERVAVVYDYVSGNDRRRT